MRKTLTRLLLGAIVAAGLAGLPAPASAHPIPAVIEGRSESLHPEGVAYDPTRGAFLVTSLKHGTVSVVRGDGSTRTLVDDPALIETIGLQVDVARGRILVASADQGLGDRTSPATAGRTAGLGVYSLRTGERIAYVDLAAVASDGGGHFANDIAVAPDGTAYVTDTAAGIVYRVDRSGRASVLVRDGRLTFPGGFGANGIVYRAGVLLVGNYSAGTLWRIPVARPAELRQVRLDGGVVGADGITLEADGSLIVVTNALSGEATDKVVELRLSRDWTSARVVESRIWPDRVPTTAAAARGTVWVLSGNMDVLLSGAGTSDEFTVRRF